MEISARHDGSSRILHLKQERRLRPLLKSMPGVRCQFGPVALILLSSQRGNLRDNRDLIQSHRQQTFLRHCERVPEPNH